MKWQDSDSLSWNDLSHFTYNDMLLGKLELLEKANQDIIVPDEIVDKLRSLCSEVLDANGDSSIHIPKDKKHNLGNVVTFIKYVIKFIELNDATSSFDDTFFSKLLEIVSSLKELI